MRNRMGKAIIQDDNLVPKPHWADPTPEMLDTPEFRAVWNCIKRWDISVPNAYNGYMGATGNHVRAILEALAQVRPGVIRTETLRGAQ